MELPQSCTKPSSWVLNGLKWLIYGYCVPSQLFFVIEYMKITFAMENTIVLKKGNDAIFQFIVTLRTKDLEGWCYLHQLKLSEKDLLMYILKLPSSLGFSSVLHPYTIMNSTIKRPQTNNCTRVRFPSITIIFVMRALGFPFLNSILHWIFVFQWTSIMYLICQF